MSTMSVTARLLAAVLMVCFCAQSLAHVPYYEPQVFWQRSPTLEPTDLDWSFENPWTLPAGGKYSPVNGARAIWSVLGANDTFDVISFSIPAGQNETLSQVYANVPACEDYVNFYPGVALLGPANSSLLTANASQIAPGSLPFDIPAGYAAIVRNQPQANRTATAIDEGFGILLPAGYNDSCFETPPCDVAASTIEGPYVLTEGTWYIVVYDADKSADRPARDVLLLMGEEGPTPWEAVVEEYNTESKLYRYGGLVHSATCRLPNVGVEEEE